MLPAPIRRRLDGNCHSDDHEEERRWEQRNGRAAWREGKRELVKEMRRGGNNCKRRGEESETDESGEFGGKDKWREVREKVGRSE